MAKKKIYIQIINNSAFCNLQFLSKKIQMKADNWPGLWETKRLRVVEIRRERLPTAAV